MDPPQFSRHLAKYLASSSDMNNRGDDFTRNDYNSENPQPSHRIGLTPSPMSLGHHTSSAPDVQSMQPSNVSTSIGKSVHTNLPLSSQQPTSLNVHWQGNYLNECRPTSTRVPFENLGNMPIRYQWVKSNERVGLTNSTDNLNCKMTDFTPMINPQNNMLPQRVYDAPTNFKQSGYESAILFDHTQNQLNTTPRQLPSMETVMAKRTALNASLPIGDTSAFGEGLNYNVPGTLEPRTSNSSITMPNDFGYTDQNDKKYKVRDSIIFSDVKEQQPKKLRQLPLITPQGPQPIKTLEQTLVKTAPGIPNLRPINDDHQVSRFVNNRAHTDNMIAQPEHNIEIKSNRAVTGPTVLAQRQNVQTKTLAKTSIPRQLPIITKQGVLKLREPMDEGETKLPTRMNDFNHSLNDRSRKKYSFEHVKKDNCDIYDNDLTESGDYAEDYSYDDDEAQNDQDRKKISLTSPIDYDNCDDSLVQHGDTQMDGDEQMVASDEISAELKSDERFIEEDYVSSESGEEEAKMRNDKHDSVSSDDYISHTDQGLNDDLMENSTEDIVSDKDNSYVEPEHLNGDIVDEEGEFFSALATVPEEESRVSERDEDDLAKEYRFEDQSQIHSDLDQDRLGNHQSNFRHDVSENFDVYPIGNQSRGSAFESAHNIDKKLPTIVENGFEAQVMQYIAGKTGLRRGELFSVDEEPSSFNDDAESRSSQKTNRFSDLGPNKEVNGDANERRTESVTDIANDPSKLNDSEHMLDSMTYKQQYKKNNFQEEVSDHQEDITLINESFANGNHQDCEKQDKIELDRRKICNDYETDQELGDEQILISPTNVGKTSFEQEEYDEQYRDINNLHDLDRRATNHVHAIDGHSKSMLNDIHQQQTIFDYYDGADDENLKGQDVTNDVEDYLDKDLQQLHQPLMNGPIHDIDRATRAEHFEQQSFNEMNREGDTFMKTDQPEHEHYDVNYYNDQHEREYLRDQHHHDQDVDEIKFEVKRPSEITLDEPAHDAFDGNLPRARIMWMTAVSKIVNRAGGVLCCYRVLCLIFNRDIVSRLQESV